MCLKEKMGSSTALAVTITNVTTMDKSLSKCYSPLRLHLRPELAPLDCNQSQYECFALESKRSYSIDDSENCSSVDSFSMSSPPSTPVVRLKYRTLECPPPPTKRIKYIEDEPSYPLPETLRFPEF